jgi:hypothetical protein
MLTRTLCGGLLVAATVFVHVAGLILSIRLLARINSLPPTRFWHITWLLIQVTWSMLFIHATEIAVWALFYFWSGCLPTAEASFYFSGVTYATVGYGDLVLPQRWRLLAPVEGLTGILMCGLSTGVFFLVVSRLFSGRLKLSDS